MISNLNKNYNILYIIKILNKKVVSNTHYDKYLCIFRSLKRYLQIIDKNLFQILYNLHFRKKRELKYLKIFLIYYT